MWRGLSRTWSGAQALCALMLALLIVLPSFDFACAAEGLGQPPVAVAASIVTPASPKSTPAHEQGQPCAHGHCHHNVIADLATAPLPVAVAVQTSSHAWSAAGSPVSTPASRLERPPRV